MSPWVAAVSIMGVLWGVPLVVAGVLFVQHAREQHRNVVSASFLVPSDTHLVDRMGAVMVGEVEVFLTEQCQADNEGEEN